MKGYAPHGTQDPLPDIFYSLVPRHISGEPPRPVYSFHMSSNAQHSVMDSRSNNKSHEYYRPEFERVVSRYISLRRQNKGLRAFIADRQELSTKMMQVCDI
jgi:hypothetical protein